MTAGQCRCHHKVQCCLTRCTMKVPPYLRLAKAEFLQHNNPYYASAVDLPEKI